MICICKQTADDERTALSHSLRLVLWQVGHGLVVLAIRRTLALLAGVVVDAVISSRGRAIEELLHIRIDLGIVGRDNEGEQGVLPRTRELAVYPEVVRRRSLAPFDSTCVEFWDDDAWSAFDAYAQCLLGTAMAIGHEQISIHFYSSTYDICLAAGNYMQTNRATGRSRPLRISGSIASVQGDDDDEEDEEEEEEDQVVADDPSMPNEFRCPITQMPMKKPVILCDGHTYECRAIQKWLLKKRTSPVTGKSLMNTTMTVNHALLKLIRDWTPTGTAKPAAAAQKRTLTAAEKEEEEDLFGGSDDDDDDDDDDSLKEQKIKEAIAAQLHNKEFEAIYGQENDDEVVERADGLFKQLVAAEMDRSGAGPSGVSATGVAPPARKRMKKALKKPSHA